MKKILLYILYYMGFLKAWCYIRNKRIIFITLHGVMDKGVESSWNPLRERTSRNLLDETLLLAKNYLNFISIDKAVAMINGKIPLQANSCVVTFDDGQRNNYQLALPILRKHNIPATFYPATSVLNTGEAYWFDRLDYVIQQDGLHGYVITQEAFEVQINHTTRESIRKTLNNLISELKEHSKTDTAFQQNIANICDNLEKMSGKSIDELQPDDMWSSPLNWEQVRECADTEDVTIGSHTVNHIRMTLSDDETVRNELIHSKQEIESHIDGQCKHFCYPNGDYDDRTAKLVSEAGYISAVTTDEGSNKVGDDIYKLRRYSFPTKGSAIKALFAITGVFEYIRGND